MALTRLNTNIDAHKSSSSEVYGFEITNVGTNPHLKVTTTSSGTSNIADSVYKNFDDVIYASTGYSFAINSSGHLILTTS